MGFVQYALLKERLTEGEARGFLAEARESLEDLGTDSRLGVSIGVEQNIDAPLMGDALEHAGDAGTVGHGEPLVIKHVAEGSTDTRAELGEAVDGSAANAI